MDVLWKFLYSQEFVIVASIASIISLALTVWVLITVRNIKNFYLFKARIDTLTRKLKKNTLQIEDNFDDFESQLPQLELKFGQAIVTLKSLKGKLDKQSRKQVDDLLKAIRDYDWASNSREKLWSIFVSMKGIVTQIENLQKDREMER